MRKITWMILLLTLTLTSCANGPRSVAVASKDGNSCLLEKKCKITVRSYEKVGESMGEGGNAYYRCYVSNEFYEVVGVNEPILVKIEDCEKVSQ